MLAFSDRLKHEAAKASFMKGQKKLVGVIDRALPRFVAVAVLTEMFGYSQLELTERELGTEPTTARLLRARVAQVLGLKGQ